MDEKTAQTIISNNSFTGVQWDGQAIEAVNTVALALLNLTELFKAQHIVIEALLKVETGKPINEAPEITITPDDIEGVDKLSKTEE